MATASPAGFQNATVAKAILLASVGASLVQQVALRGNRPGSLPLRAFAPFLAVQHPGELVASTMLIYSFRLFERRWGSAKFAAFGIETTTGSCLIQLVLQRLLRLPCSTGPYGFLFGALVPFSFEVPPVTTFSLFGWKVTDKVFVYLAAAQMLFSSPRSSTLSALSGVLSGLVVTCSSMREWKVPRPVCQWFGCSLGRLLRSTPARPAGRLPPGGHQRPGVTQASAPVVPQPDQAVVEQLVSMGFDPSHAAAALQQSHNDIQGALARLL